MVSWTCIVISWYYKTFLWILASAVSLLLLLWNLSDFDNSSTKLVLSLESSISFDKRFKVISVPFFVLDFNLLSCELDDFIFKVLYSVSALTVPCGKFKIVSFDSSILKNVFLRRSKFRVKLISCIAFESVWNAFCLLKSNAIILLDVHLNKDNLVQNPMCIHICLS